MALTHGVAERVLVSDRSLVSRSRRGDRDAFARLYDRYRSPLYQVCLRRLRDPNLAEDVVHETFLRALSHIGSFDIQRRMFPWLATIAQNACVDVLRSRSRTNLLDDFEESEDGPGLQLVSTGSDTTVESVLSSEERRKLGQALAQLPARQRRVLLLYALDNWSYADIALAEQSSVASIKSIIFRARDNLKKICERGLISVFVIPWLRLRARVQRLNASIDATWTNIVTRSLSAVQMLVAPAIGIVMALSISTPVPTHVGVVDHPTIASQSLVSYHSPARTYSSRETDQTSVLPADTSSAVRPMVNSSTTRPGAVVPSKSHITIDVVDPDGTLLYRSETTLECEGGGHTVLPDDGPITAAC